MVLGRWAAPKRPNCGARQRSPAQKSVRRYEEMGTLNETWQELKPKHMEFCEKSLKKTFLT